MNDQYQIELGKYSLQKFKKSLQTRNLIPSRTSLKDELDARFRILQNSGITNLKELVDVLKTKVKVEQFSRETGLSIEYTAEDFIRIYEEQTKKKADFGVGEIEFSLDLARELNIAVEI